MFAVGFVFRFLGCLGFKGHPDRIPLVPRGRPWPPARWPPPPPLTTHMPSNLPLVCAGMSTSTVLHILLTILVHSTQMGSVSATSAKCAKLVIKFNYCKITLQKKYLNNFFRLLCLWLNFFFSYTVQNALAMSHNDALATSPANGSRDSLVPKLKVSSGD